MHTVDCVHLSQPLPKNKSKVGGWTSAWTIITSKQTFIKMFFS